MITLIKSKNRKTWLTERASRIGGSDAACIVGLNPWRSNVELWEIKKGLKKADDLSKNALVAYGSKAEKYLRELYKLDFPDCTVTYIANNLYVNDRYPFAHASLDGLITDNAGRTGILEIKTATIQSAAQRAKWDAGHIPDNYYLQVLHYMAVMEADFADIKAQLKYDHDGDLMIVTKHYHIERAEVLADIDYLMAEEEKFAATLAGDTPPALMLPEI